ncbi:MAG TPA: hypothetical protein DCW60_04540 [Sutterella sp.]|nr:hypothetical protein [Sutterella sp.]
MSFLFAPAPQAVLPLDEDDKTFFPVRRVFGIAANSGTYEGEKPPAKFFMKSPDCVVPVTSKTLVELPYDGKSRDFRHEVELVVAIGAQAKNISPEKALDVVYGYACGLDMTRMDMRRPDTPWEAAKSFEAAAPITAIRKKERMPDPWDLRLWLYVNNDLRQDGSTKDFIRSVADVISEISHVWPLLPGDLIMTGTPLGAAAINAGDVITCGIEGIFSMKVVYGKKA